VVSSKACTTDTLTDSGADYADSSSTDYTDYADSLQAPGRGVAALPVTWVRGPGEPVRPRPGSPGPRTHVTGTAASRPPGASSGGSIAACAVAPVLESPSKPPWFASATRVIRV